MEFIVNIVIPIILLVAMAYVIYHQYLEQAERSEARKQAEDEYLKNKTK